MKAEWKDVSSYSRSSQNRDPNTFELRRNADTITVHRHICSSPDVWLVSCHRLGVGPRELESLDIEDAKREAVELVRQRLRAALAALDDGPTRSDGWHRATPRSRIRFEDGKPVELAVNLDGVGDSGKAPEVRAAGKAIGQDLWVWGAWVMHPVTREHHIHVMPRADYEALENTG